MIDLDELLGIAGPIILVDVSGLEFLWLDNCLSDGARAQKLPSPMG
jgi:hypothetical protein